MHIEQTNAHSFLTAEHFDWTFSFLTKELLVMAPLYLLLAAAVSMVSIVTAHGNVFNFTTDGTYNQGFLRMFSLATLTVALSCS